VRVALRAERIWEAKVLPAMAPVNGAKVESVGGLAVQGREGAVLG